jgi:hypothetical protein
LVIAENISLGVLVRWAFDYGSFVNSVVGFVSYKYINFQHHSGLLVAIHFSRLCLGLTAKTLSLPILSLMADSSFVGCCPFEINYFILLLNLLNLLNLN